MYPGVIIIGTPLEERIHITKEKGMTLINQVVRWKPGRSQNCVGSR